MFQDASSGIETLLADLDLKTFLFLSIFSVAYVAEVLSFVKFRFGGAKRVNGLLSCYLLAPINLLVVRFVDSGIGRKYGGVHTMMIFSIWLVHVYSWW